MLAGYVTPGVAAGLVAGVVFGLFVAIVANPLVAYADEHAHGGAESEHDHGASEPLVGPIETVSVVSGGLWAVPLGGVVFGIGCYILEPEIPSISAGKSYALIVISVSHFRWFAKTGRRTTGNGLH